MATVLNKKYMEFPLLILAFLLLMVVLSKAPAGDTTAVMADKKGTVSVFFPFTFGFGLGPGF